MQTLMKFYSTQRSSFRNLACDVLCSYSLKFGMYSTVLLEKVYIVFTFTVTYQKSQGRIKYGMLPVYCV